MKFNIKKKFLAAAVCFALSASNALAMPSGGTVVVGDGNITGVTPGTLANGATITATSNGVIDWTSFSIGNGESLTFALGGNTVLNRVTGDQLSSLLGTLDASSGNLILSNPNGIVVGNGANISANNLMLTTLSLENDAVNNLFKDNDCIATLTNKNRTNGVTINGGIIEITKALDVIGGTVTVADGVSITGMPTPTDIHLVAANKVDVSGGDAGVVSAVSTSANVVNIGTEGGSSTTLNTYNNVGLYGGSINVNNTNIKSNNIDIFASTVNNNNGSTITANTANTVNIKNSRLESKYDTFAVGHSVSISNGYINTSNGQVEIAAVKKYSENAAPEAFSDNKVTISSDTIFANSDSTMVYAGAAIVDDNYYGTKGQQEINRGDDGNVHAIILVSSTQNPANINDIAEDTTVEKIHEVASKITDANVVLDILNNIASGNVNLSDEKKQQIVQAIMEYSPVMADKNQEIKNQDAASQAEGTAAPLENASNTGATSDNDAESAVTVDSNSSDNNESEE
ncbi:MAG: filamentous hemagglutinin N-terminal domain-containing protein [Selenomonadaceae bacterium]|nr:filamentous hemagglutinin N-terminal domain-containing protein [Selenomonadaceae bacterium]